MERRLASRQDHGGEVVNNFKEKSWSNRYSTMGDIAETAFIGVYPHAHRLGLNRPDFDVRGMADPMRYAPDFMMSDGLYEVMGVASRGDSLLKIKFEKLDALSTWMCIGPVNLFIYDSSKKRYWEGGLREWIKACHRCAEVARFPDNKKPYFALHIDDFPAEPIRHDV